MKILAIEFSSPQRGVAVYSSGGASSPEVLEEAVESGGVTTEPFRMSREVLDRAGIPREEIDCVAVGLGPGSYNGIRVSIAIAQGWQLARPVKLVGLDSARLIAEESLAQGIAGNVQVVIDAQRGEFYLAGYELSENGVRLTEPLRLAARSEAETACAGDVIPVGPEVSRWFPHGRIVMPRAAVLARLAVLETHFVAGEELAPVYLRETAFVKAPPPRVIL